MLSSMAFKQLKKCIFPKLNWKTMFVEPLKHISAAQMFQGHGSKTTQTDGTGNLRGHREVGLCSAGSALMILSQPSHTFSGVLKAMVLEKKPNIFCHFCTVSEGQRKIMGRKKPRLCYHLALRPLSQ